MLPLLLLVCCVLGCTTSALHAEPVVRHRGGERPAIGSGGSVGGSAVSPLPPRERRNAVQNLCDRAGCRCSGASMVQCNFTEHSVSLNAHTHYLNAAITVVEFNLSAHSQLQIQAGFLHNNRVQRLACHGGLQFELATDALAANAGAKFQQIDVFGTAHVVLGTRALRGELTLHVRDARRVIVRREAFYDARFTAEFRAVADLSMHEAALQGAHHKSHVVVLDSRMEDVWPLAASLSEFRVERTRVQTIRTRAFDVQQLDAIEFRGCEIGEVEPRAFTEKLYGISLQFVDCTIARLSSEALSESGIAHVLLSDNRIAHIESNALHRLSTERTTISNNTIGLAATLWLNQITWQRVRIAANRFGTYGRVRLAAETANPLNCTFADNLITETREPESLYFESAACAVRNITYAMRCNCSDVWQSALFRGGRPLDGQLQQVNCAVGAAERTCYNTTHMVWPEYRAEVCTRSRRYVACSELEAKRERTRMQIEGFTRPLEGAGDRGGLFGTAVSWAQVAAVAGGLGVLVMLLIALGMVCNRLKVERLRRGGASAAGGADAAGCGGDEANDSGHCFAEQILTRCDATALVAREARAYRTCDRNATQMPLMIALAMKPSKSFTADDRAIIRQTLLEMRERYGGAGPLYDQVHNHTVKVLNGGLSEAEKVRAIGEIVEALHECQQRWGGEFVAFTDILYRQLVPADGEQGGAAGAATAEDPVYAELSDDASTNVTTTALGAENIYAEPHQHVQQLPLLPVGEYAWPLDRDAPAYSEYAEPHRAADNQTMRHIISPYAIAATTSPLAHHTSRPTAAPRLPDLLPTAPSTSSTMSASHNYRQYPPPPYSLTATPHATTRPTQPPPPVKPPVYSLPKPKVRPPQPKPSTSAASTSAASTSAASSSAGADDETQNMSDHSGGSDVTFRADELLYADASAPTTPAD